MRTPQEIFDAVIDAGLYWGTANGSTQYMCCALRTALVLGHVSSDEYAAADHAVREYLGEGCAEGGRGEALEGALHRWGFALHDWGTLPEGRSFWNFTKLYRGWANRPMPEAPALADHQEFNPE